MSSYDHVAQAIALPDGALEFRYHVRDDGGHGLALVHRVGGRIHAVVEVPVDAFEGVRSALDAVEAAATTGAR